MPRGGAHFSSEELAQVLSHYKIGVIHQVKPLSAGNRRAPKVIVISDQGKFLLKRRPKGKDDLYRVVFAHAVQSYLAEKKFPVSSIVLTCDENNTILQINSHLYEFFRFIEGTRYNGSAEATIDAGRQLAKFHQYLTEFIFQPRPLKANFHDSSAVRRQLKNTPRAMLRASRRKTDPEKSSGERDKLQLTIDKLTSLYNKSSVRVNELGIDTWPEQVIHGDWHPGNMLFAGNKLVAALDFDSVKISTPVTDLANAMLHFSIVGNRPNPVNWPAYLDQARLVQFLNGYRHITKLQKNKLDSLLDLMIETMITEAILPIAATGFFGSLGGTDFLKMIYRKARWIDKNRKTLTEAIFTAG